MEPPHDRETECECRQTGVLVDQTYGRTAPPADAVLIQRCDQCERYPGDLDAAVAYATTTGGTVHAVGDGEMFAPQSDPWVTPGGPGGIVWHRTAEAIAAGLYTEEDR
jgi:hypothetical protein